MRKKEIESTIFNSDKGKCSRRTDLVDIVLYVRKINRCLEEKCIKELGVRKFRV